MKSIDLRKTLAAAFLVAALPFGAVQASSDHAMTEGTIRKVDTEQGKVTIKHGPIANLDMPPMTMVFGMKDPTMLEGMKKGDDVNFHVVMDGTNMVIEELEAR